MRKRRNECVKTIIDTSHGFFFVSLVLCMKMSFFVETRQWCKSWEKTKRTYENHHWHVLCFWLYCFLYVNYIVLLRRVTDGFCIIRMRFICKLHCFIETCQRWFLYNNDVFLYVNYIVDASLQGGWQCRDASMWPEI